MASGAGSNFVSLYPLSQVNAAGVTAVASPLAAYGTIGVNDSGGWCAEARAFSKASFQLEQVGSTALSGFSITCYVCTTPAAWQTWFNALQGPGSHPVPAGAGQVYGGASAVPGTITPQGFTNAAGYAPGVAPQAWAPMPAPSEQTGTGGVANPMTPASPFLIISFPVVAVRFVVTAVNSPAGLFNVSALIIP